MSDVQLEDLEVEGFPIDYLTRMNPRPALEVAAFGPLTAEHVKAASEHMEGAVVLGVGTHSPIKAIRNSHHRLAQMLAMGTDQVVAGKLCNYSPMRINQLLNDPSFQELLSYYANDVREEWADFVSSAANLSLDFLGLLQEQLDQTPEKFTPGMALEAIRTLADRTGHAPVQKSINVNVNADAADRLSRARARARSVAALDAPIEGEAKLVER